MFSTLEDEDCTMYSTLEDCTMYSTLEDCTCIPPILISGICFRHR